MQPRALARRGVPVDGQIPSEQSYSVISRLAEQQPFSIDPAGLQPTAQLSRVASLIVITLLSVGLWAAIWAVVSSMAALWPR